MSEPKNKKPLVDDMGAMAFVKSSHLCAGLEDEYYEALYLAGEVLGFESGADVFQPGDIDDGLYFVQEGTVVLARSHQGEFIEIDNFVRQGVFGETGVLREQPRTCLALARGETIVIRVSGPAVRRVAESAKKFGRRLAMLMAVRAKDVEKKLSTLQEEGQASS